MLFWEWALTLLGLGGREWMRARVRVRNPIWPKWREWVGFGEFRRRRRFVRNEGIQYYNPPFRKEKKSINHYVLMETR